MRRGKPPERESKKGANPESQRNLEAELDKLKHEYEQAKNDAWPTSTHQRAFLGKDEKIRLQRAEKKICRLENRIQQLEAELMSSEEKSRRMEKIRELLSQLRSLYDDLDTPYEDRLRIRKEINNLKVGLSQEELDSLYKIESVGFSDQELLGFRDRFEATAEKAVEYGIAGIRNVLEGEWRENGKMPTTIIYPETASRPLRYAVAPLLDLTYKEKGQDLPQEFFMKTYSSLHQEHALDSKLEYIRSELKELSSHRLRLIEKREDLLRRMRRERSRERRGRCSDKLNIIKKKIDELEKIIQEKTGTLRALEQGGYEDVMQERMHEILSHSEDGKVLVIDDVLSGGRTFDQVEKALRENDYADSEYFAFIARGNAGVSRVDDQRISIGSLLSSDADEDNIDFGHVEHVIDFSDDEDNPDRDLEWGELMFLGFPFRAEKQKATGVSKIQTDLNPYVEKSDERDSEEMERTRRQYREWGEQAVLRLKAD